MACGHGCHACKKALGDKGIKMCHFVQCQVQMMATGVPHCLLVGWQVEECKVVYVPFDADWCRQMVVMLASVIAAAIPLRGQGQRFRSCQAMTNLCSAQKNAVVFSKSCAALEV